MKIVFYGRTQVGTVVLSYLVAKGHEVKVIPEDEMTESLAKKYGLPIVTFDTMGDFHLFVCCHGKKIIKPEYLKLGRFVNMHSCLWKYKGKDPISRYIENGDTDASIESHFMVEEVDAGEILERVLFTTPVVKNHAEYFNIALPHYYECIDRTMKHFTDRAAMTRYRDNPDLLKRWLNYYSKHFKGLYIFGCDTNDGMVTGMIKDFGANFISVVPQIYSMDAHEKVFQKQVELLKDHEWVFYSDMDEFVVPDPSLYRDLTDFMNKCGEDQTFCEGYEVLMDKEEQPLDWRPLNEQRHLWARDRSGSYNKPCLSRIKTNWREGFHSINEMVSDDAKKIENTGLYLLHIKHVNSIDPPDYCNQSGLSNSDIIREIPKKIIEQL